jgi:class 3 adenylate cyclase
MEDDVIVCLSCHKIENSKTMMEKETAHTRPDIVDDSVDVSGDDSDDDSVVLAEEHSDRLTSTKTGGEDERRTLGRKETRAVSVLRFIVIVVIASAAALVATGVYIFTRGSEEDEFETQFAAHSNRVVESFQDSVELKLGAIDALSILTTSHALSTGATFPNVTIPNFEVHGASTRILADALLLFWMPLVTDETRDGWEEFSVANQNQLITSFIAETTLRDAQDELYESDRRLQALGEFHENIYGVGEDGSAVDKPEGSGPFLPLWQMSPALPLPELLNVNLLDISSSAGSYNEVLRSKEAVLGASNDLTDGEDAIFNVFLANGQYRASMEEYDERSPITSMAYPVFDSFGADREVVGVLATNLYWRLYFEDILPPDANGIICVLENTFNQTSTYAIYGPDVKYLGPGDLHDSRFDYLEVVDEVTNYVQARSSRETRSYTSVDLNSEYNRYTLRVYPSRTMENDYVTSTPVVFASIVAFIFVFTSLVFVSYDWLVQRRQKVVMDKAVKSGAIVSSLYPEVVRDRLFEEKEKAPVKDNMWKSSMYGAKAFEKPVEPANKARPIADNFLNTTVLFADIVGFTSWSSKRQPTEVFELLETLYHTFDEIAARHGVFKVETIGDCYMAVTGVPEPQDDHAVRMVKFARDCMIIMAPQVLVSLQDQLGKDTADLGFRVGLHSGSVTAGVLRGSKSRFQLFGDTVNTASRMESNGSKGRLHISQTTADELTKAGKAHWLTPREDKIVAKGKGEMQTYWVTWKSFTTATKSINL